MSGKGKAPTPTTDIDAGAKFWEDLVGREIKFALDWGQLDERQERDQRRQRLLQKVQALGFGASIGLAVGLYAGTFAEDRLWFFRYLRAHGDVE